MDLKRLMTHFTFRIEPKPGGGFIAHATDPSVPPLEAATREELQQKIRDQIAAAIKQEFPALQSQPGGKVNFSFHIERKSDGGFDIHSADPNTAPTFAASHDEVESHFAEKFLSVVGKQILPQLSPELAQQLTSGNVKVFINKKSGFTVTTSSVDGPSTLPLPGSSASSNFQGTGSSTVQTATFSSPVSGTISSTDDSPIKPEPSSSSKFLKLLFIAAVFALVAWFFLHR